MKRRFVCDLVWDAWNLRIALYRHESAPRPPQQCLSWIPALPSGIVLAFGAALLVAERYRRRG